MDENHLVHEKTQNNTSNDLIQTETEPPIAVALSQSEDLKAKEGKRSRGRKNRPYPLEPFEDCYNFSKQIFDFGTGQKVRRLGFFERIGKSPDSSASRALITNSSKYGLVKGSYASDHLELTQEGLNCFREEVSNYEKQKLLLKLVFEDIVVFNFIYERLKGNKLPNQTVIADILKDDFKDIEAEDITTMVELFVVNAQFLRLLRTLSGAERLVTFDYCLEDYSKNVSAPTINTIYTSTAHADASVTGEKTEENPLEQICFYVTPIGNDDSEERLHADLFLGSIIEPALETIGLKVIRSDKIDKPGTITKQIIEYLSKAKLVVADLSFNNPNVFYELAIRHAFRLPTVQIIRKGDKIPFDVSNTRTISIDTTSIYTLVPKIDTYRLEIANKARQALTDPDNVDNPLTSVYPNIKLTV